jgi:uncharacterized protein (TIGR03437 family)
VTYPLKLGFERDLAQTPTVRTLFFSIALIFIPFSAVCAAPPHYFVTTFAGMVPPLANPIAARQYLDNPSAVAYDPKGNLYYATYFQVWRLNPDGTDTLIAGNGNSSGSLGSGNPRDVSFFQISAMVCDSQGNLYIVDGRIWKLTTDGKIGLLASNNGVYFQYGAYTLAVDGSDNLYASGYSEGNVNKYQAATGGFTTVAQLPTNDGVFGMAASGSILYLEHSANFAELLRFDLQSGGFLSPIPTTSAGESATAVGPDGSIYIASGATVLEGNAGVGFRTIAGAGVGGYSGDGGPATEASLDIGGSVTSPGVIAVNPLNGDVAISEGPNHVFRVISGATRIIRTVAGQPHFGGDNGPAILALVDAGSTPYGPNFLSMDRSGNFYFLDGNNARIRKITPSGVISTIAGTGSFGSSGDGGKATQANVGWFDGNIVVDQAGNIYFGNYGGVNGDTIRMVDLNGNIHTVAGGGSSPIAGGVQATGANLGGILCIALDTSGNLYFAQTSKADSGKSQIFKVDGSNTLSVYAGTPTGGFAYSTDGTPAIRAYLGIVRSMVFNSNGLLCFADASEGLIRMVDAQGNLATIAGIYTGIAYMDPIGAGPALNTRLYAPTSLVFDAAGNLYFANQTTYGPQIVVVDTAGNLTPIGGNPPASIANGTIPGEFSSGDGGDSLKAGFGSVIGLTLDSAGNIYVLDFGVYIRKLSPYDPAHPPPFLSTGGVIGAGGSTPPVLAVSPDGLATVYGSNFIAPGTSHNLQNSDLVNGKLPTNMVGVCASFGGVPAAMSSIYPGQLNVQVPALPPGPVTVQVTLNCGTSTAITSNFAGVIVQAASPEFFSFLPDPVAGNNPIAAINAVTFGLIGAPGLLAGATFTPAKAGTIVEAYGTGWGLTNPALGVGVIPGAAVTLASPYTLTLGGTNLPASSILYAGASPCCAGLYQVDFTVPAGTPSGNQPLVITVGGVPSASHAFIAVQ